MRSKEQQIRDWFAKVASDLKIAGTESRSAQPATDAVCFHYQQAAEKLLNTWLLWKDHPPVRTHNIEVLLAACEKWDREFAALRPAEALTPYAVELRYGDPAYFPTLEEMKEAEKLASLVEAFIVDRFMQDGFDPRPGSS
ncbi:MAG: HEPN domain-containing protein [Planctomycetota bacterium]